ncbi:hypothetical protein RHSIM_Rhsim08G0210600 [Rhododendron simsii]|uniref:F-box domain-containing protein n=1 Tax=Rhododendron simsii TaxID=118357 RepID=A0A834GFT5_RHOSS|nr:hypothetical protein RHSIM_Rhsim08G0210600 [Rhododendron simsii]
MNKAAAFLLLFPAVCNSHSCCCDDHLHDSDDSPPNQLDIHLYSSWTLQNQAPPLLGTTCLFKRALVTFKSNAMGSKKGTLRFSSSNTCGITNEGYLPREIWVDILTRLPAKMVGQCKCICKHWRTLIEEPSFVELHHFRAKSRPGGCYLVISSCTPDLKDIIFFSANYEGGLAQHLFSYPASGFYDFQACVNGLICVYFHNPKSIVIVNPITKEIIALPPFNPPSNGYAKKGKFRLDLVPLVSFGFDPSSKQYKVVNIYRVMKQSTRGELESSHCECEIFTLGSLSWRKIDIIPPASHFEFGADGICLGGVIHWRNFSSHPVHDEVVVTFDLKDERFGVISLPTGPSCMPRLVELGGHLAACEELPENEVEELWLLEDYDNWVWVKERIMLPPDRVAPNRFIQTTGSIQTGEILLHDIVPGQSPSLEIYYYGRNKRSLRKIDIAGIPNDDFINRKLGYQVRGFGNPVARQLAATLQPLRASSFGFPFYRGAIGDCLQAIKLDDSIWQMHYCMGLAYFHLKKYKDAKSALFKGADLAAGYRSWFDDLILNCNDADAELPVDAAAKEVVPPVNELLKMLAYTIMPGRNTNLV